MKVNEGTVDRVIRVIVGVVLVAAAYFATTGVWSIVLYVVAAILLITGAVGFCPLYTLLGISTTKKA